MAFEGVSEKLQAVFKRLNSRGKLNEGDVKEAIREIKLALRDADVNFMVVKDFVKTVTAKMMEGHGEDIPVSQFPNDGRWPTATTQWEKRNIAVQVSQWDPEACIQCGRCSLVCPHGCIRMKVATPEALKAAGAA